MVKCVVKERGGLCGVDWSASGQVPVAGCFARGNDTSTSIKCYNFLDWLRNCQFLVCCMAWSGVEFTMDYLTLKMDVTRFFKICGTTNSATRRHIPEGCNLLEDICWPPMYPASLRNTNCLNDLHKPLYENQLIVEYTQFLYISFPCHKLYQNSDVCFVYSMI